VSGLFIRTYFTLLIWNSHLTYLSWGATLT